MTIGERIKGGPPRDCHDPGLFVRPARLAGLARAGFGEVEFPLHHDGDTRHTLAPRITEHLRTFAQHGHISRDSRRDSGHDARGGERYRWAFIHGNWSLANGRPDRNLPPAVTRLPPGARFTAPPTSLSVLVGDGPGAKG